LHDEDRRPEQTTVVVNNTISSANTNNVTSTGNLDSGSGNLNSPNQSRVTGVQAPPQVYPPLSYAPIYAPSNAPSNLPSYAPSNQPLQSAPGVNARELWTQIIARMQEAKREVTSRADATRHAGTQRRAPRKHHGHHKHHGHRENSRDVQDDHDYASLLNALKNRDIT